MGNHAITLDAAQWSYLNDFSLWLHGERSMPEIQEKTLAFLSGIVPCHAALFDLCKTNDSGHIEYVNPVGLHISDESLRSYYREFSQQDYTTWSFNPYQPVVYRDLDIVDVSLRDASPIYRDWMAPQGLYYGMGCTIVANEMLCGSVTLFRKRDSGDFSNDELELLRQANRHLCLRFADLFPHGFTGGVLSGEIERCWNGEQEGTAAQLAPREAEVLGLMLSGKTNREMAKAMFISESTLKKHVNAIYRKLGVRNRLELAGRFGHQDV